MSTESKYSPGDIVKLRNGRSNESNHFKYAELYSRGFYRKGLGYSWGTTNKGLEANGIWESEIERLADEEEYEKHQLQQALK